MDFQVAQAGPVHFREIEVGTRRTASSGALHPDQCPKLRLHGVDFAIPPRGATSAPKFEDGKVSVSMAGEDDWPEADELLRAAPVIEYAMCKECGQAKRAALEIELEGGADFLVKCFALAAKLLRKQYDLDDVQASEVLGFASGDTPEWIAQLMRWCNGLGTEAPEIEAYADDLEEFNIETPATDVWEEARAQIGRGKRWWQVWK